MAGDLKSVVLHSMTLSSVKSDFEVPVGLKISGVDNSTFSLTGEAYSHVVAPKTESTAARVLQKDDVALGKTHLDASLCLRLAYAACPPLLTWTFLVCRLLAAYEFGRKFPGYTAENLTEKGVSYTPKSRSGRPVLLTTTHHTHVFAIALRSQIHEVQARRFCLIALSVAPF